MEAYLDRPLTQLQHYAPRALLREECCKCSKIRMRSPTPWRARGNTGPVSQGEHRASEPGGTRGQWAQIQDETVWGAVSGSVCCIFSFSIHPNVMYTTRDVHNLQPCDLQSSSLSDLCGRQRGMIALPQRCLWGSGVTELFLSACVGCHLSLMWCQVTPQLLSLSDSLLFISLKCSSSFLKEGFMHGKLSHVTLNYILYNEYLTPTADHSRRIHKYR